MRSRRRSRSARRMPGFMYVTDALVGGRQGQGHPGSGLGAAARPLPDRDRLEHAEPGRRGRLHQAADEHRRVASCWSTTASACPKLPPVKKPAKKKKQGRASRRSSRRAAASGAARVGPAVRGSSASTRRSRESRPSVPFPAAARPAPSSSTSSIASPSAMRPGSTTQQSSATWPPNARTIRRSTRGSCSSVSGSNVVMTQRVRRLRTPISDAAGTQAIAPASRPRRGRRHPRSRCSAGSAGDRRRRPRPSRREHRERQACRSADRDRRPLKRTSSTPGPAAARTRSRARRRRPRQARRPAARRRRPSDPWRPSSPGRKRDVTTRPDCWRTCTRRSPAMPSSAMSATASRSPRSDLTG